MRRTFFAALLSAVVVLGGSASAQMPDARQMSGLPLPVSDLATGTVSVRVVRGTVANVIPDHPVTLTGTGTPINVKTNSTGRAEFTGLTPGSHVTAETIVDGQKLVSQSFEVPRTGGVRMLLVAADPSAPPVEQPSQPSQPAQPGTVSLGDETRFVFELGDDGINVFNIIQIVNASKAPVQTAPLVFELPDQGEHASLMEGSTEQATVAGQRVTVNGPFKPGPTLLQFAYTIPYARDGLTFRQTLPAALPQLTVIAQKLGALHVTSPQFAAHREMPADGQNYILGHGPALKAGETITLNFTGLPHAPLWPRNIALALAVAILIAGAWASVRVHRSAPRAAGKLETKRERLFGELTALEEQHRRGAVDQARYETRRRDLVAALEQVYAQMDEEAAA